MHCVFDKGKEEKLNEPDWFEPEDHVGLVLHWCFSVLFPQGMYRHLALAHISIH